MSEQKKTSESDAIARSTVAISVVFGLLAKLINTALWNKKTWTKNALKFWATYCLALTALAYAPSWDLPRIFDSLSWIFPLGLGRWVYFHLTPSAQVLIFTGLPFLTWLTVLGAYLMVKVSRFQKALDHLGIKTTTNIKPVVIDSINMGESQKKIIVKAVGIDVNEFKNKKGAIESSFNAIVEDIRVPERNRQLVEILIAEKALPQLVRYDEMALKYLIEPYTFLIGESLSGFLVGNLLDIHHMIVAGSSGNGKSFFFKQAIIGILESSKRIQFYLIDLKRGVEMSVFGALDNVRIAKEVPDAIVILTAVVAEMERRFKYLETNKFTEIIPERDKMDRIIVGIDEASVLFTIEKSSKSTRAAAESARDLTDRIAKLGRAAAIHLIVATQKVVKETIDTRIQTNINARIIFRVGTSPASMTVLGNNLAYELPNIKGRGIWNVGSQFITLQVPKLGPDEVTERVDLLTDKFNGQSKPFFGPMLEVMPKKTKVKKAFEKKETPKESDDDVEDAV